MPAVDPILWERGIIAPWYLREDQFPIYELLLQTDRPFVECARRYGKTTTILCYVLERLIQNAGWVCLWCEPDKNQAREIVQPEITKLFKMAPRHMRPVWSTEDSFYWFPSTGNRETASRLKLRGVNHDRGDSARGPFANIIVADEYGFWRDPGYTIQEALAPQLQTTLGPLIKASTPPEDLGHAYYEDKVEAMVAGRFVQRVIYDNKSLSEQAFQSIVKDCKGVHTPAFRREYLCEPVSDPERLVIPEYDESVHDVPDDYPRPAHFDAYVGIDLGFNDNTAMLFAYVDFLKRELVIDDVLLVSGKNSKEITDSAKAKELSLWGRRLDDGRISPKPDSEVDRVSDNDLQQIYDMQTLCSYFVRATAKDDKIAALNELRLLFTGARIKIKKRCGPLRYQLKVGLWNERRTDFQRGEKTGHLDAIAALIYLSRNVNWHHNPYPQYGVDVSHATHYIPESDSQGSEEKALEKAFGSAL